MGYTSFDDWIINGGELEISVGAAYEYMKIGTTSGGAHGRGHPWPVPSRLIDRVTAWGLLAEIGLDMNQFPDAKHLASWAGLCLGNWESAGKRKSGRTRKGSLWLRRCLCQGLGDFHQTDWREVIAVVADLRDNGIDQAPPSVVYWPILNNRNGGANAVRSLAYVIHTPRAGSLDLRQEIQQAVASVNPNLPLADVKTMESVYGRSLVPLWRWCCWRSRAACLCW